MLSYGQDIRLGMPYGHYGHVNDVQLSSDGNYLFSSSEDGRANIWRVSDGKVVLSLLFRGSKYGGQDKIQFSHNEEFIAIVTSDGTVEVYDLMTSKLKYRFIEPQTVGKVEFTDDDRYLIGLSKRAVLWDLADGSVYKTYDSLTTKRLNSQIKGGLVPGGKFIHTFSKGKLNIWDIASGNLIQQLNIHTGYTFSDDGRFVFSSTLNGGYFSWWEVASAQKKHSKIMGFRMISKFHFSSDGKFVTVIDLYDVAAKYDIETGRKVFKHRTRGYVKEFVVSPTAKYFAISDFRGGVEVRKFNGDSLVYQLSFKSIVSSLRILDKSKELLVGLENGEVHIINWRTDTKRSYSGEILEIIGQKVVKENKVTMIGFSNKDIRRLSENGTHWSDVKLKANFRGFKLDPLGRYALLNGSIMDTDLDSVYYRRDGKGLAFSKDGKLWVSKSYRNIYNIYNTSNGKLVGSFKSRVDATHAMFSANGEFLCLANDGYNGKAEVFNLETLRKIHSVSNPLKKWSGMHVLDLSSDGSKMLLDVDANAWNESSSLREWDFNAGKVSRSFESLSYRYDWAKYYNGGVLVAGSMPDIHWVSDITHKDSVIIRLPFASLRDIYLTDQSISAVADGVSRVYVNLVNNDFMTTSFLEDGGWVHLASNGFFDASPGAMEKMYWLQGKDVIDFDQLKHRYWIPGLAEKIMNGEALPDIKSVGSIKLEPMVELGQIQEGRVPIRITKRAGGYGKVSLFINGKEVAENILPKDLDTSLKEQMVLFDVSEHRYLTSDTNYNNTIGVVAYSEDEFVQGKGVEVEYLIEEEKQIQPHFYGIVLGVSDYVNQNINLKYTTADAKAISTAIGLGAEKLFKERTHLYTLHSEGDVRPTKDAIKSIFDTIAQQATADDIIFIYLSGHGVNYGGAYGDFYFLTADAISSRSQDYRDDYVRNTQAISTAEITEWLKEISALKQVMIIDACGSGKAVENLIASRSVESSQIKAIDRMKERTGMFIISGCAADAVSYEASRYGQGLLTYAILQAMKGAALRKNRFVDVNTIFTYARETVPELAGDIHGIQEPQLLMPSQGSFDIGILTADLQNLIPLNQPKPVFVRSMFLDQSSLEDVLMLSQKFDASLEEVSDKGNLSILYMDVPVMDHGNRITGIYEQQGSVILLNYNIRMNNTSHIGQISAYSVEELVQILQKKVAELL
ncbi:MAG: caspase family protein [Bacteroidia bacterium]